MDTNNFRPTSPSGESTVTDEYDWRTMLQPGARQKICNKIMDTVRRHLPCSGQEGLKETRKSVERFEEKIFTAASSQTDYLRTIALKMLTMESKSQNTMPYPGSNSKPPDPASHPGSELSGQAIGDDRREEVYQNNFMDTNTWRPTPPSGDPTMYNGDWRASLQPDSRQRIVNKIMDTLKRHLPFSGQEGLKELRKIAERFEEKIFRAACSQTDYLKRISLKMVVMDSKCQNTVLYAGSNSKLPYPGFEKANGNTSTTDFGKPNIAEQPHDDPMAKVKPRSVESLVLKSAPKSDGADRRGKKRLNPPRQSEARKALKTEIKIETHLS